MYHLNIVLYLLFQSFIPKALFQPVDEIRSNVSELKFLSAGDKCANFDPEKEKMRQYRRYMEIAANDLIAEGEYTQGRAAGKPNFLGIWDWGAPLKRAGAEMKAEGFALAARALTIEVESQELEYMKCAKADFDQFKKEFDESRQEFKQFQQQFNEFQKEFDEFREQFNQFKVYVELEFEKVHEHLTVIEKKVDEAATAIFELKKIVVWGRYREITTTITTMKEKFDISKMIIIEGKDVALAGACLKYDMDHNFNLLLTFVLKDIFTVNMSYEYLRIVSNGIFNDLKEMGKVGIACFTANYGIFDKQRIDEHYDSKIAPKIKELYEQIINKLRELRTQTLEEIRAKVEHMNGAPYPRKGYSNEKNIATEEYLSQYEKWTTFAHLWLHSDHLVSSGNVIIEGSVSLEKLSENLQPLKLSTVYENYILENELYHTQYFHIFWCEKFDYQQQVNQSAQFQNSFIQQLDEFKKELQFTCNEILLKRLIHIYFFVQSFLNAAYAEASTTPWKAILVGGIVNMTSHGLEISNIAEISFNLCDETYVINVCF